MAITYPKLSQLRLSPLNQRRVKPSAIESRKRQKIDHC